MEGSTVMGHREQSDEGLTLKATELRLGLPGTDHDDDIESQHDIHHMNINMTSSANKNNKRLSPDESEDDRNSSAKSILDHETAAPAPKAQIVGWPPVRSYRKNNMVVGEEKKSSAESGGMYVKVSMDGAPYLRKIDLKVYSTNGYPDLLKNLETMFNFTIGSEYATAYEDKDGDLMLLGDVPWDMFMSSCKRLRIMKGSDARGLGCSGL